MNINYHYFVVKTLALKAGFGEEDAQLISSYSQFIDDFDLHSYIRLDSVPDYARSLAHKLPLFGWIFNPVTTGFNSNLDYARLCLDKYQRTVVVPFHFIPQQPLADQGTDRSTWRISIASLDTPSVMTDLLINARTQYKNSADRYNLMRIGMLLHIFADTYSHQGFSGFWGWENYSKLTSVVNNMNEEDITASYKPDQFFCYPSVGHANVSYAPDDSNVRFEMRQKLNENDEYSVYYNRSNTRDYVDISKEILNFLLSCLGAPPIEEGEWEAFYTLLVQGFKTEEKDINTLCAYWHSIFQSNTYQYSKKNLLNSYFQIADKNNFSLEKAEEEEMLENLLSNEQQTLSPVVLAVKSDDFFHYNVMAKEICDAVNGYDVNDNEFDIYVNDFIAKESQSSQRL